MSQGTVAAKLRQTVNKWWRRFLKGETEGQKAFRAAILRQQGGENRVPQISRKTRPAAKLTRKGYPVSRATVHRTMKETFGLEAYKRPLKPKISEKQHKSRLEFCKTWKKPDS